MQIQSLSIDVPVKKCVNDCPFCVVQLHPTGYENRIMDPNTTVLVEHDYIARLQFARDNGCNTVMFTGEGEPLQSREFLNDFMGWNELLNTPFRWIELQTTGVMLTDKTLDWLRKKIGVTTISLSVADLFDNDNNLDTIFVPNALRFDLTTLAQQIVKKGFILRFSLNLLKSLERRSPANVIARMAAMGAQQVTFRVMYKTPYMSQPQYQWIANNEVSDDWVSQLISYIRATGVPLERLPYGPMRYALHDMSCVVDDDCMATDSKEELKYLILRPDCHLYSKWDQKASLIF